MPASSAEQMSSATDDLSELPVDYWFGKRYFECLVAQDVSQSVPEASSIAVIDAQLEKALREYPYREAFHSIQSTLLRHLKVQKDMNGCDGYRELITLIGMGLRLGQPSSNRKLREAIRKFSENGVQDDSESDTEHESVSNSDHQSDSDRESSTMSESVDTQARSFSTVRSVSDEVPESQYHLYTVWLDTESKRRGIEAVYSPPQLSRDDPTIFVRELSFDGRRVTGSGRNHVKAKHKAAKEMHDAILADRS